LEFTLIGMAAPILILVGRLVQGLSAGVELGGVSIYLSEIALKGREGFFVSFQSFSQQVALFGGFTPAVSTFLVRKTGSAASPAIWLGYAALSGLIATLMTRNRLTGSVDDAGTIFSSR
jgi:MFS family permease